MCLHTGTLFQLLLAQRRNYDGKLSFTEFTVGVNKVSKYTTHFTVRNVYEQRKNHFITSGLS